MQDKSMSSCVLFSTSLIAAAVLSGCGFKSDLFLPDSDAVDVLFERDTQPAIETAPVLEGMPAAVNDGEIMVDKVTMVASEGRILVAPGTEEVNEDGDDDGIVIDLTDVTRDVERERNDQ